MHLHALSFPMRPYPGVDETPVSFASRYAAINGYPSMAAWASLAGHPAYAIASGRPETLAWLSSLDGGDPDRYALALTGQGERFRIGQEPLRKLNMCRSRLRVCPRCIADDLEVDGYPELVRPYGRIWWHVRPLRTCHIHETRLHEVGVEDASANLKGLDFTPALRRHLPDLERMADDAPFVAPTARETYLLDRLRGTNCTPKDLLDSMPFFAVVRTCEIVGSVAAAGPTETVRHLDEDQVLDRADLGFEILADGPAALNDLMRTMVDRVLAEPQGRWAIKPMIGYLHDGLYRRNDNTAYDPIRAVVREFVLDNFPVLPEDKLFGSPIGTRRVHSIRTASLETGMHPSTLRNRLAEHGIIPSRMPEVTDDRVTFPSDALARLPDLSGKVMGLVDLGRHLGIPRGPLAIIGSSGLIDSVREPGQNGAFRFGFALSEVERFRSRLFDGSLEVGEPPPGAADLTTVRHRACRKLMDILPVVLEPGRVTKYRLEGRWDYSALLLDLAEITSLLRDEDHGGIAIYKVRKLLGVGPTAVARLIDEGLLKVRMARNPINRCEQKIVDRTEIEGFKRDYVMLSDLSKEAGLDSTVVRRNLFKQGVQPVFRCPPSGPTIYRRIDVMRN